MTRDAGLSAIFRKHLPLAHCQSVETWSTGQGVPDLNYCYKGCEGWVEFKRIRGWRIKIEPQQIAWLERRARVGGRVFVAARRIEPPQTFCLFKGEDARLLGGSIKEHPALIRAEGNPASWPWSAIEYWLTN